MPQFPSALSAFKSRTRRTFSPHLPDPISPMCKRMYFREICFFSFLLVARAISPLFLSTLSLHSLSPLSLSLHRLSRSPGCSRDHYSCSKLHRATRLHSGSITALDTSSTTHRLRCCQSGCAVPLPCRKRSWRKSLSLLDLEALQGQGVRLGLWATTLGIQINARWEMNAGLIILRVESESESGGTAAAAAPLQQQLRCSSSSVAAAAPSQQQLRRSSTTTWYSNGRLLAASLLEVLLFLEVLLAASRGGGRGASAAPRGGTRDAAACAPS